MPFYRVPFLAADGVWTDDGRNFENLTHRILPLPLAFQDDTQHAVMSTSEIVGQIISISKGTDGTSSAIIEVDPKDDNGRALHDQGGRAAQMIEKGGQGISIDGLLPIDATITEECVSEDEDGWCIRARVRFSEVIIGGATLTPIPAYEQAIVDPTPVDAEGNPLAEGPSLALVASAMESDVPSLVARSGMTLTAAAAVDLASWTLKPEHFARPELTADANYNNVDDDGRCWGWVAPADRCHQGIPGQCVLASNESPDMSDFLRNRIKVGDQEVWVGFITMDVGHQNPNEPAARSAAHYDDTDKIAAIVTAGIVPPGEYSAGSVWYSGSIKPTLDAWRKSIFMAAQCSGDWRGDPGDSTRTLRAALVVPVPGFLRKREPVLASAGCGCGSHEPAACSCNQSVEPDAAMLAALRNAPPLQVTGPPIEIKYDAAMLAFLADRHLRSLDDAMPDPLPALDARMEA